MEGHGMRFAAAQGVALRAHTRVPLKASRRPTRSSPGNKKAPRGAKPVNTRQIPIAAQPPAPQRLHQIAPLIRQRASMDADLALRIAAPTSPPQPDAAAITHLL